MLSRTALVTGANRGIGHEIARQLSAAGVAVVVGSRELTAQLAARDLGPEIRAEQLDVSDPHSVAACEGQLHRGVANCPRVRAGHARSKMGRVVNISTGHAHFAERAPLVSDASG